MLAKLEMPNHDQGVAWATEVATLQAISINLMNDILSAKYF